MNPVYRSYCPGSVWTTLPTLEGVITSHVMPIGNGLDSSDVLPLGLVCTQPVTVKDLNMSYLCTPAMQGLWLFTA